MVFGVKLTQNVFRFEQVFQDFLDKIGNSAFFYHCGFVFIAVRKIGAEGWLAVAGANKRSRIKMYHGS